MAARELKDFDVVLVGVGLPNLAANLAKRLYFPNIILIYESGAINSSPPRQPLSIGDSTLVEDVSAIFPVFELFSYIVQRGMVNVGFLGAAQVDLAGNINTTVIGDYVDPKVRLPGSGGACEISFYSGKTVIITNFSRLKIRKQVDFVTSSGINDSPDITKHRPDSQRGRMITDKCIVELNDSGHFEITKVYSSTDLEDLKKEAEAIGIDFKKPLDTVKDPSEEELEVLHSLDKGTMYLK